MRAKTLSNYQRAALAELAKRELARRNILDYTKYTFKKFQPTWFHQNFYRILQSFTDRKINKLMITMPPQTGKSEGVSRRMPSFLQGKNPGLKSAIVQYSGTKARKTGREIKHIMSQQVYKNVFPNTIIPTRKDLNLVNSADVIEFESGEDKGNILFTGRGGGLTGEPLDLLNIDDIIKDAAEANSPTIRQNIYDFYDTVAESRLHNDSQQIITNTRWHDKDLSGYIQDNDDFIELKTWDQLDNAYKDVWYLINFEALKLSAPTEIDPRGEGEALYPEKHSREKLERTRERLNKTEPEKWNSLYMGNPRPVTGLLYGAGFKTWDDLPELVDRRAAVDVADTGKDYLCVVCYAVGVDNYLYGLDFYYTQSPQEVTEEETADILIRNKINTADIESNAGGRAFARNVERIIRRRGETTEINTFTQRGNKESRIITNASNIMRVFLMPHGWISKYPVFAEAINGFRKIFKSNTHDDGPDTLTMAYEYSGLCEEGDGIIVRVV